MRTIPYRIRSAFPADLAGVRDLLIETWHDTYDGLYGAPVVDAICQRWHSLGTLTLQADQAGTAFLVAIGRDRMLLATSLAMISTVDVECVDLQRLYVLPQAQGHGVGRALLRETLARYPAARTVRLEVEPRNLRAIAFYESEGFVRVGMIEHGSDAGGRWNALLMQKRLAG